MELRNGELLDILGALRKLNNLHGWKFVLTLGENRTMMKERVEQVNSIKEESEEFKAFRKEVQATQIKFADKDESGQPILTDITLSNGRKGQKLSLTPENEEKLSKALKKLEKANQHLIDEQQKKEEEFYKALDAKCDIHFKKIKKSDVPAETTVEQSEIIEFMIEF